MNRELFMYPNYSKGGVSAVLRGRAAASSDTDFHAVFDRDMKGRGAYSGFNNITPRVVRPDRQASYLKYTSTRFSIGSASVLSHPSGASILGNLPDLFLAYEFHSSDMNVVSAELAKLDLNRIDEYRVPSEYMASRLQRISPKRVYQRLRVVPNVIDSSVFSVTGPSDFLSHRARVETEGHEVPIVWVGRFDKGKGYGYLLRTLAMLPENYRAYFVVSLENDPNRLIEFVSEAAALGVSERVSVFADLSPATLANLFRSARDMGGCLVSTSLLESFGFSVAEALATGLKVRAFDLPVWREHDSFARLGVSVAPGSVMELAESISD
ncbi:glycosyltransferase family 4 protein [Brevibacterium renqingii]|uniref:glycosyltransferase family 4 protein n=1 Tax=Brevibacterium renqingii TaxID=2776916 RepID=UPI001AE076EF|nr:glycosyltransferase family 4 protein [Brevibacterium renqingii]